MSKLYTHTGRIITPDSGGGTIVNVEGGDSPLNASQFKKAIIDSERSYYFDDTYIGVTSYEDTSYLEKLCDSVPNGKHFIFNTDSHIDYNNGVGFRQKETDVIAYVKERLNIKHVVFGGDVIGARDSKYEAAKILSLYCIEKYNALADSFLFVVGNHDANAPAIKGNVTEADALIDDVQIYNKSLRYYLPYGVARFDEDGIALVDEMELSASDKEQLKAWMKMHYYVDDTEQRIRYIVIESGDGGYTLRNILSTGGYYANLMYLDWLYDVLKNTPNDMDVVVTMHMINYSYENGGNVSINGVFENVLAKVLGAFKNKGTYSFTHPSSWAPNKTSRYLPSNVSDYFYMRGNDSYARTFDFSESEWDCRLFVISGHWHFDDAHILSENTDEEYVGTEYLNNPITDETSLLYIICDRCCAWDASASSTAGNSQQPHAVTYEETTQARLGTPNEVLFDVVTITPDNKIVLTRFGGGNSREYDIP